MKQKNFSSFRDPPNVSLLAPFVNMMKWIAVEIAVNVIVIARKNHAHAVSRNQIHTHMYLDANAQMPSAIGNINKP